MAKLNHEVKRMNALPFNDKAADFLDRVGKGAFLTTAANGKVNTMTIGWASLGMIWATPVLTAMVRPSRFTHELLDASMEFTVTLPNEDLSAALGLCGSTSGRSGDKLAAAGLSVLMHLLILYNPVLSAIFMTTPLGLADWALVLLVSGWTTILGGIGHLVFGRRRPAAAVPLRR